MNTYNYYKSLLSKSWLTAFEKKKIKSQMRLILKQAKKKKVKQKSKYVTVKRNRRTEYKAYLQSAKWKLIRKEVLDRDNYRCVYCYSKQDLHVHHLTYNNFKNENLSDLITLCKICHKGEHSK